MKQTLILSLLFSLSVSGKGQFVDSSVIGGQLLYVHPFDTGLKGPESYTDTIRCIMLVSDTSYFSYSTVVLPFHKGYQFPISQTDPKTIRGYEIRQVNFAYENTYFGRFAIAQMQWVKHYEHVEYLDENKLPLKYFVWMSKTISKPD